MRTYVAIDCTDHTYAYLDVDVYWMHTIKDVIPILYMYLEITLCSVDFLGSYQPVR